MESLKTPPGALSLAALAGVCASSAYFAIEIKKLKESNTDMAAELKDMREHLAQVILATNKTNDKYERLTRSVADVGGKVSKVMATQGKQPGQTLTMPIGKPFISTYTRYTKREEVQQDVDDDDISLMSA